MFSGSAAIALAGVAACGLAAWLYARWASGKDATTTDLIVSPEPSPAEPGPEVEPVDPNEVLDALRRDLLAGDLAARDDGDHDYALPFLETEPHHHEVDADAKAPEDPFEDTVPGFSWAHLDPDSRR